MNEQEYDGSLMLESKSAKRLADMMEQFLGDGEFQIKSKVMTITGNLPRCDSDGTLSLTLTIHEPENVGQLTLGIFQGYISNLWNIQRSILTMDYREGNEVIWSLASSEFWYE